ncbi:hypothetical protein THAOC_17544, partial [Thalassiosira oceanica]
GRSGKERQTGARAPPRRLTAVRKTSSPPGKSESFCRGRHQGESGDPNRSGGERRGSAPVPENRPRPKAAAENPAAQGTRDDEKGGERLV